MASRYRGPLRVYRVADARHPLFDSRGAAQSGGRWNSPGRRAIYGALSYAAALLEKLAQAGIGKVPHRQHWIVIDIPEDVDIEEVSAADGPRWNSPDLLASRAYGDQWFAERRTVVLVVPSVVGRPHERNAVINQDHPKFDRLTASDPQPVLWDPRLAAPTASGSEAEDR
jgi:RES domain-containing protein